jgi:hypothetical protein
MADDPSASLPAQSGSWAATKATYRMFDRPAATFASLSEGHWRQTRTAAAAAARDGGGVVLLIQDTTWLDFGSHPATDGLGWCLGGTSATGDKGLFLHSVLAVRPPPTAGDEGAGAGAGEGEELAGRRQHPPVPPAEVLGLMHAKLWARQGKPTGRGKVRKAAAAAAAAVPSEALRWSEAVEQVGSPTEARAAG